MVARLSYLGLQGCVSVSVHTLWLVYYFNFGASQSPTCSLRGQGGGWLSFLPQGHDHLPPMLEVVPRLLRQERGTLPWGWLSGGQHGGCPCDSEEATRRAGQGPEGAPGTLSCGERLGMGHRWLCKRSSADGPTHMKSHSFNPGLGETLSQ